MSLLMQIEDLEPRLSVNEQYKLQLKNRQNQEMFSYLQEKYREFQWIMKSLHTRKRYIKRINEYLTR